jgi:hypothetical protein
MKLEEGELVATGAELAASVAVLGIQIGDLARIPRVASTMEDQEAVESFFQKVAEDLGDAYKAAIKTLASPSRIGVMHYALGEESISRAILAWGEATGNHVVMMVSAGGWHIRVVPIESLVNTVSSVLLEDVPLNSTDVRCTVTQESALVLLAAQHLLRESRLMALLSHTESSTAFTVEAVEDVLDDAATEDFRWPFLFLDKILPFSTNGVNWGETIPEAMKELSGRELVEEVEGSEKSTWQLTESGYRLALAHHHHLTKVGIRITETDDAGKKGHEALLFIRSLQDLVAYDLAGQEAAIATLDVVDGIQSLVGNFLSLDKLEQDEIKEAGKEGTRSCPACGEKMAANMRFCSSCGMEMAGSGSEVEPMPETPAPKKRPRPVPTKREQEHVEPTSTSTEQEPDTQARPKFCRHCGKTIQASNKFCKGCGAKVVE